MLGKLYLFCLSSFYLEMLNRKILNKLLQEKPVNRLYLCGSFCTESVPLSPGRLLLKREALAGVSLLGRSSCRAMELPRGWQLRLCGREGTAVKPSPGSAKGGEQGFEGTGVAWLISEVWVCVTPRAIPGRPSQPPRRGTGQGRAAGSGWALPGAL